MHAMMDVTLVNDTRESVVTYTAALTEISGALRNGSGEFCTFVNVFT